MDSDKDFIVIKTYKTYFDIKLAVKIYINLMIVN